MDGVFYGVNSGLLVLDEVTEECDRFVKMVNVLLEGLEGLLGGGVGMLEVGHSLMKIGRGLGI